MKILRVIASMNPAHGGPSQGIRNSIPAMEALGVYNEVVSFDPPEAPFLKDISFPIHAIGPAQGPYTYCKTLSHWLFSNLHRFHAVIIHGLWLHNSYGTYRVWKKYKKSHTRAPRLYVMPHGMLDPYFQRAKSRRLKAFRNWVFWHLIERRIVNNADGVLFTCEQELLLARETFGRYHPKKELNVGYGIAEPPPSTPSLKHAFLAHCPALKDQSYWLFMSRIHPKKGLDLLLKAYLKLRTDHPNLPALVIAGPGLETDYGKNSIKLADNDPHIFFTGMLTGNAKWGALYGCEIFILPSHQENFGIAIAEALACSKPVLTTNKVNIWREVQCMGAGFIENNNLQGISRLLTKWRELPYSEKTEMAESAEKSYLRDFHIQRHAVRLTHSINHQ